MKIKPKPGKKSDQQKRRQGNDPDEIAEAMHTALEMPLEERQERHASLRKAVFEVTAARYCNVFVDALAA